MRFTLLLVFAFLLVLPVSAQNDPVGLFDGKTFEGWDGPRDWFRIEDGAIVGGTLKQPIPQNEFLCTDASYQNFELRLQVRLRGDDTNAGVQYRSERVAGSNEVAGYQADLGQQYWGALYDEARRRRLLAQPDMDKIRPVLNAGWNDYRIRVEGNRLRHWINNYQTIDYTEQEAGIAESGTICLQIHSGPAAEAWYRDIILTPLPSGN